MARHAATPTYPPLLRAHALLVLGVLHLGIVSLLQAQDRPNLPVLDAAAVQVAAAPGVEPAEADPATIPGPASRPAPSLPTAAPVVPARQAAPVKRWLPEGTGMWTYRWENTEGGSARMVVHRAKAIGLSHIYVRTGTRKGGFDGGPVLDQLLPATRGTDIKVIAWDFPFLENPKAEAARLAAAARYVAPGRGTPRVAAVAPDIETGAEGTKLNTQAVDTYYRELRRLLPPEIAIIATIPWPSEHRVGKYPYETTARWADALAPMAYWINRDPVVVTKQSMGRLAKYKKPVMPVGQAYDPRIDVPTIRLGAPSAGQVMAFMSTARSLGAKSISLWVWNTASTEHWRALGLGRKLFDPSVKAPARTPAKPPAPPSRPATPASRRTGPPTQATRAG